LSRSTKTNKSFPLKGFAASLKMGRNFEALLATANSRICFLIGLSKIAGAFCCVRVVINGSLLAETNSAIADALNSPSARYVVHLYRI
jgi:hypothetical protein